MRLPGCTALSLHHSSILTNASRPVRPDHPPLSPAGTDLSEGRKGASACSLLRDERAFTLSPRSDRDTGGVAPRPSMGPCGPGQGARWPVCLTA